MTQTLRPGPLCVVIALSLLVGGLLSACADVKRGAKSKACSKAYEQCEQASGVLGVCDVVECAAGQPAPCLVCRSQH